VFYLKTNSLVILIISVIMVKVGNCRAKSSVKEMKTAKLFNKFTVWLLSNTHISFVLNICKNVSMITSIFARTAPIVKLIKGWWLGESVLTISTIWLPMNILQDKRG
jgi:hypothetical protein